MDIHEFQKIVHQTREFRRTQTIPKSPPAERDMLIKKFHPDFRESAYRPIRFGPNAGELTVREVADLLEGDSPLPADLELEPQYSVDVLVVGEVGPDPPRPCTRTLKAPRSSWPRNCGSVIPTP